MIHNLLDISDLSCEELNYIIDIASMPVSSLPRLLEGRGVAMIFEKPSLRTRNSTELAVAALGGHPVYIQSEEVGIGVRETPEDVARVLASYHAAICARVIRHETLRSMVTAIESQQESYEWATGIPVINLLSDLAHPSQAIADILTIQAELGNPEGKIITYIGDPNNVFRSLMEVCAMKGMLLQCACPDTYMPSENDISLINSLGADIEVFNDPLRAVVGSDIIYTDTWVSMGDEVEADIRREAFRGFTVNDELVAASGQDPVVMHCLPAHRGEEITNSVLYGKYSAVWLQAANRLPAIAAVLVWALGGKAAIGKAAIDRALPGMASTDEVSTNMALTDRALTDNTSTTEVKDSGSMSMGVDQ